MPLLVALAVLLLACAPSPVLPLDAPLVDVAADSGAPDAAAGADVAADAPAPLDAPQGPEAGADGATGEDVRPDAAEATPAPDAEPDARPTPPDVALHCVAPLADCDRSADNGCEVDTRSDRENCGACRFACHFNARCMGAVCVPCPGNLRRCGEECVNIVTSDLNCGACGSACPTGQRCSDAACRR